MMHLSLLFSNDVVSPIFLYICFEICTRDLEPGHELGLDVAPGLMFPSRNNQQAYFILFDCFLRSSRPFFIAQ